MPSGEKEVRNLLKRLEKDDLIGLIDRLRNRLNGADEEILGYLSKRLDPKIPEMKYLSDSITDDLALKYWSDARDIVEDFNEYGGGDEDEELEFSQLLDSVREQIGKGVSYDVRAEISEEAFDQYSAGNSGMDDLLMDFLFDLCQSREEWLQLIEWLRERGSDWNRYLIMKIYREHLHDNESYLKLRMANLRLGDDYLELCEFYRKKDPEEAIRIAITGLEKGEGNLDGLADFLFPHLMGKRNDDLVRHLTGEIVRRNEGSEHIFELAFDYWHKFGVRNEMLPSLRQWYSVERWNLWKVYEKMRKTLEKDEFSRESEEILKIAEKNDPKSYMKMCWDLGYKDRMLSRILHPESGDWTLMPDGMDGFATLLESDYPEEMLQYFIGKAENLIRAGQRKNYRVASEYLHEVKIIESDIMLMGSEWEKRIRELRERYHGRPAFIEELNRYGNG